MTSQEERANRALEAVLAWARAERDSDRRGTELFEMRQAIARAPAIANTIDDLNAAGKVREAAEVALHDACVREDLAEEKLKELGRAMLDEERAEDAKTIERQQALADVAEMMRGR